MISVFRSACYAAALATLATSIASSGNARAADDSLIQRCEAEDGNAVYTDKPCTQLQAHPAPMSDDLAIRLAMAEAAESTAVSTLSSGPYRDASEPLAASIGAPLDAVSPDATPTAPSLATRALRPGRRAPSSGCAHSPQQLSQDLLGAFALRDVNRVAESYHWVGMNQRQALPVMKRLEHLSSRPLADARYLAAWIRSSDEDEGDAAVTRADAGMMQLVFAGGERIIDFNVRRYSGCYFIVA